MKQLITFLLTLSIVYSYVGWDGEAYVEFDDSDNEHGMVLRSTGYIYDITGVGINTDYINRRVSQKHKGIIIYLGKDCDAYSRRYGKGGWEWANGGFLVNLESTSYAFGRQQVVMSKVHDMNMTKCEF